MSDQQQVGVDRRPPHFFSSGAFAHVAPYAVFLAVIEIGRYFSGSGTLLFLVPRVLLPAAVLVACVLRGSYTEIAHYRWSAKGAVADVTIGVAVAGLWIAPYVWGWLSPPSETTFTPTAFSPEVRPWALLLRAGGFALVTPFVEELFVRSFLVRFVDGRVYRKVADFRLLPIGRYRPAGFVISLLWFTFSHALWEWPVAFATGAIYNLWLYHRRHLGAVIIAHAVTNACVFAAVLAASQRGINLWYFL